MPRPPDAPSARSIMSFVSDYDAGSGVKADSKILACCALNVLSPRKFLYYVDDWIVELGTSN